MTRLSRKYLKQSCYISVTDVVKIGNRTRPDSHRLSLRGQCRSWLVFHPPKGYEAYRMYLTERQCPVKTISCTTEGQYASRELPPHTALGVTHPSLLEVGASSFTDKTCRFIGNPQRSQSPEAWIRPVPCLLVRTAQCVRGFEFSTPLLSRTIQHSWDSISSYRTCKNNKDGECIPSLLTSFVEEGVLPACNPDKARPVRNPRVYSRYQGCSRSHCKSRRPCGA